MSKFVRVSVLSATLTLFAGLALPSAIARQEAGDDFPELSQDELPITESLSGLQPIFAPSNEAVSEAEGELEGDATSYEDGELSYELQPAVLLRGLDKISGQATDLKVATGDKILFGGLRVTVKACYQAPPTEPPESIAYLEIEDYGFSIEDPSLLEDEIDSESRVFHGWMFASSPGQNALEHPIYDVWVINCMAEAPERSDVGSAS